MKNILKLILFLTILNIGLFTISNATTTEYDVKQVANFLMDIKVLNGYPDGDLKLNNNITREEFSKLIVLVSNFKNSIDLTSQSSTFKDVDGRRWSAPYIKVAVQNSILQGYPDLTFRPTNNINLEEASIISLRLLNYTANDYGISWPYSQVNYAKEKGILNGVNKNVGEYISRQDAINIIFNTLCSKVNATSYTYMNILKYTTIEDAIIIATNKQDKSLEVNQVYTSAGIFKCINNIREDIIATKATIVLNEDREVVSVVPQKQNVKKYSIKSVIENGIIVNENGTDRLIKIDNATIVYYKKQQLTLSNISNIVSSGNIIYINYDKNNNVNFAILADSEYIGPIVVSNENIKQNYASKEGLTIIKNNKIVSSNSININDVIYYYENSKEVVVYDNKVTGTIEQILPNKYNISSIIIGGREYKLETENAFNKLKQYDEGSSVTLLLGKDSSIVDILNSKDLSIEKLGLLIDTGVQQVTSSYGNNYTKYYASIITTDGAVSKFSVDKDYKKDINSIVKLYYSDYNKSLAIKTIGSKRDISGIVNAKNKKIGNTSLSENVTILEIPMVDNNYIPFTKTISLSRLDGVNISSSSIIYYTKDSYGNIDSLIITDVTNDMYDYAIVLKEQNISPYSSQTMYTYNQNGNEFVATTQNMNYNVGIRKPVAILAQNGNIFDMNKLTKVTGKISTEKGLKLISNSKEYSLESNIIVYIKKDQDKYLTTNLDEYIRSNSLTNITAYYDKEENKGGKIRMIVID